MCGPRGPWGSVVGVKCGEVLYDEGVVNGVEFAEIESKFYKVVGCIMDEVGGGGGFGGGGRPWFQGNIPEVHAVQSDLFLARFASQAYDGRWFEAFAKILGLRFRAYLEPQ